ncbi:MAG: RNB domain-containing ribonuclease [Candidatus Accumulibacter sp.]|jgi:exoribonuclease-2|nr:RNB domain-containing ribonuclease [Accumulibacter sp.]
MYVLFEESGVFKAANVLADSGTSLQIEMSSGKRAKIKTGNILLCFVAPPPGELFAEADALAKEMQISFLWECADDAEFHFADFADAYFGGPGKKATPTEAAAILMALHAAPVHFHRKGKGRFRRAPAEILTAALAGLEKKRQQAISIERMNRKLQEFRLPEEFVPNIETLLYAPDGNRAETKALDAACVATGLSPVHLLQKCGAIPSPYAYHFRRFLRAYFPEGTDFPGIDFSAPQIDLPYADVRAFSIDDAKTTEIDDACSLRPLPEGGWRIGIHIAAPALGFAPDSAIDRAARQRLSTVYIPGNRITMLPETAIREFSLAESGVRPVISLYLTVSPDFEVIASESTIERVLIAANLRIQDIEPLFNEKTIAEGLSNFPFRDELLTLWKFARAREISRGKPSAPQGTRDYNFLIEGNPDTPENCRIRIAARKRGSPIDTLVSELMIAANGTWGALLAEREVPAIYRAQVNGKVRITTSPLPHEGLGVKCYAWSSSPLRRYVDLVNQWQLIACLDDIPPHFAARSEKLFVVMRDFELTYGAYIDFQRQMERYWCLRWIEQEKIKALEATALMRENLVRLDKLPIVLRVESVPDLRPGERVRLGIESLDLLTLQLNCRYLDTFGEMDEGIEGDIPEEAEEMD